MTKEQHMVKFSCLSLSREKIISSVKIKSNTWLLCDRDGYLIENSPDHDIDGFILGAVIFTDMHKIKCTLSEISAPFYIV